jgi:hypothetical protein
MSNTGTILLDFYDLKNALQADDPVNGLGQFVTNYIISQKFPKSGTVLTSVIDVLVNGEAPAKAGISANNISQILSYEGLPNNYNLIENYLLHHYQNVQAEHYYLMQKFRDGQSSGAYTDEIALTGEVQLFNYRNLREKQIENHALEIARNDLSLLQSPETYDPGRQADIQAILNNSEYDFHDLGDYLDFFNIKLQPSHIADQYANETGRVRYEENDNGTITVYVFKKASSIESTTRKVVHGADGSII